MAQPDGDQSARTAAGLSELVRMVIRLHPREVSLTAEGVLTSLEREGPARIAELVGRAGISQPSMTELVSRLERAGQVSRRRDPDDGRGVLVEITGAGLEAVLDRRRETSRRLARLIARLPTEDRDALRAALPALGRLHEIDAGAPAVRPG